MAKLKLETLRNSIESEVERLDTERVRQLYRDGQFPRADKVKDLDKRYRWDLLWAINNPMRRDFFDAVRELDANDSHIDSLLKAMIKPL